MSALRATIPPLSMNLEPYDHWNRCLIVRLPTILLYGEQGGRAFFPQEHLFPLLGLRIKWHSYQWETITTFEGRRSRVGVIPHGKIPRRGHPWNQVRSVGTTRSER